MLGCVNGCVHVWFSASNCCPCSDLPTVTTSHAAECRAHLIDSLRTARATPSRRPKSSNERQPIEKRGPVGALHERNYSASSSAMSAAAVALVAGGASSSDMAAAAASMSGGAVRRIPQALLHQACQSIAEQSCHRGSLCT